MAFDHARSRFRYIPIHVDSKHPRESGWVNRTYAWEDVEKGGNVGVVTGSASGIVVVDVDCKHGAAGPKSLAAWEAENGPLPATLSATTPSGGKHFYFCVPAGRTYKTSHGVLMGPGIDVQGDGSQVLIEPSRLVAPSDARAVAGEYLFDNPDCPMAELPRALLDAIPEVEARTTTDALAWSPLESGHPEYIRRLALQQQLFSEETLLLEGGGAWRYVLVFQRLGVGLLLSAEDTFQSFAQFYEPRLPPEHQWLRADRNCEAEARHAIWRAYHKPLAIGAGPDVTWQVHQGIQALKPVPARPPIPAEDEQWDVCLHSNGHQKLGKVNADQLTRHFSQHPAWAGVLYYDEFYDKIKASRRPPVAGLSLGRDSISKDDYGTLAIYLAGREGLSASRETVEMCVRAAARGRWVHPVKEYLNGLAQWDGVDRTSTWLVDYAHARPDELVSVLGRKWLISAIARIMEPGCQVDSMLVLEGNPGLGKSQLFRHLTPGFYSDSPVEIPSKDAFSGLRGVWIKVFDEMATGPRCRADDLRTFITSRVDHYRKVYDTDERDQPRTCVFAGTTNRDQYLPEQDGNRRFWPVKVEGKANIPALIADRDKLWAEALHHYRQGEAWYLENDDQAAAARALADARVETPVFREALMRYLKGKTAVSLSEVLGALSENNFASVAPYKVQAELKRICGPARHMRDCNRYQVPEPARELKLVK